MTILEVVLGVALVISSSWGLASYLLQKCEIEELVKQLDKVSKKLYRRDKNV